MRIQIYNFLLILFGHGVIFGVSSEYSRPFCEPWCLPPLWWNIYSDVICNIWYTCQICAAGRSYVLQQRNLLQLAWMSLPIYSNKTKKFNIQIFRQAFQPNRWSNAGRIAITKHTWIYFLSRLLFSNMICFPHNWHHIKRLPQLWIGPESHF